jgi:hypothetical protein
MVPVLIILKKKKVAKWLDEEEIIEKFKKIKVNPKLFTL